MKTKHIDLKKLSVPMGVVASAVAILTVLVPAVLVPTAAAATTKHKKVEDILLVQARESIPEDQLLDVGIQILDPGLPKDVDRIYDLEEAGIFIGMRESEARYIPVRLMDTLQTSGFWGAVRVVPKGLDSVDLTISGTIEESTGLRMILQVRATDATGRLWLDKRYKQPADFRAYRESRDGLARQPFQNLYNHIANDLLVMLKKLEENEITRVRTVAELKFAADLVPAAFGDYLGKDRKGRTTVLRLPSEDDSMKDRVDRIRERDYVFIDTLTEYYTNFYARMDESYGNWRKFSYDELKAESKAKRQARNRRLLGALAILGGVVGAVEGDRSTSGLVDVGIFGGSMAFQSGSAKAKEAKMHVEALRELASSFDAEMEPLLVEVEGQTLRLTGSAEVQYTEWRNLLREIFVTETGLPVDPNTGDLIETPIVAAAEDPAADDAATEAPATEDPESREN